MQSRISVVNLPWGSWAAPCPICIHHFSPPDILSVQVLRWPVSISPFPKDVFLYIYFYICLYVATAHIFIFVFVLHGFSDYKKITAQMLQKEEKYERNFKKERGDYNLDVWSHSQAQSSAPGTEGRTSWLLEAYLGLVPGGSKTRKDIGEASLWSLNIYDSQYSGVKVLNLSPSSFTYHLSGQLKTSHSEAGSWGWGRIYGLLSICKQNKTKGISSSTWITLWVPVGAPKNMMSTTKEAKAHSTWAGRRALLECSAPRAMFFRWL